MSSNENVEKKTMSFEYYNWVLLRSKILCARRQEIEGTQKYRLYFFSILILISLESYWNLKEKFIVFFWKAAHPIAKSVHESVPGFTYVQVFLCELGLKTLEFLNIRKKNLGLHWPAFFQIRQDSVHPRKYNQYHIRNVFVAIFFRISS